MKTLKRKTRARSPEKKAEQFDRILEEAKEMFIKYGTHGFSTRVLAEKLGMTQPNLYNYVKSKRELWIAIRKKYYNDYVDGIKKLIREHSGPLTDLFYKVAEYYLEYAAADYKRYQLLFVLPAPPTKKVGQLEKPYRTFQGSNIMLDLIKKAVDAKEVFPEEASKLFYSLYSLIFGAAKMEADLKIQNKISEPVVGDFFTFSAQDFRAFILKEVRDRIDETRIEKKSKLNPI